MKILAIIRDVILRSSSLLGKTIKTLKSIKMIHSMKLEKQITLSSVSYHLLIKQRTCKVHTT
jgi:hypothetical protein